jgi:hypothetical protein
MKLLIKLIWYRIQQYWIQKMKAYYLQIVCLLMDHVWLNDGSWASKARKCSRCGLREKGKTV